MALADDVALLVDWFRHDILTVAGPCYTDRCQLYDFVVAELKARASKCPHRLEPICRALENQRDDLLAFARRLDENLEQLGQELQIPAELARRLLKTLSRDERDPRRWAEEAAVRNQLRGRFHAVQLAVAALAEETVRASSLVENLNSRLRSYFFLRRHLGSDYLALLQFFLNHRRLERSDRPERVGKTPAELLDRPGTPALAGDARLHSLQPCLSRTVRGASTNLARQGTLIVRTVTRKTSILNQAGKWMV